MSIRISKRSGNSPQLMPKRAETTEVSIGEVQTERFLEGGKSARRLSRETQSSCADNGLILELPIKRDYVRVSLSR